MERHYRSIAKALTWRAGGTVPTFAVAWIITGNFKFSAGIGLMHTLVKIGAFYLHERMWNRFSFARVKPPEY